MRRADRDRLSTVRAYFFLDAGARLTEHERSLMTAMLADLVAMVADEVRSAARIGCDAANDDGGDLFEVLKASGLLDIPDLIALLLRRAEQERVASAIRALGNGKGGRFLHSLAGDRDAAISAAAMALILARSRRRDHFDSPRIDLDDVPADAAVALVYSVAASLRHEQSSASADVDRNLSEGAAAVLAVHDEGKRIEALTFAFVHALDRAGRLDEDMLRIALAEGDASVLVEALARRAGVGFETAWDHFLAGAHRLAMLLRMAEVSRPFAAEVAAKMADALASDAGEVITRFDGASEEDVERARRWWRLDRSYRAAIAAFGETGGDSPD